VSNTELPVLYSFRRCPYAMRARMAIAYSQVSVEIREVVLKDKPAEMLLASPKGTVPVLLADNQVIEESLDIMFWALSKNDPDGINLSDLSSHDSELIVKNDEVFKVHLDHYKYADRFPYCDQQHYRSQGEVFLTQIDTLLSNRPYLGGGNMSVVDMAIFPFIRQFAFVDKNWFDQSPYVFLKQWLGKFLEAELFKSVMQKIPQWHAGDKIALFPFERENFG